MGAGLSPAPVLISYLDSQAISCHSESFHVAVQTPEFTSTVPTRCVERHPTRRTVYFGGTPINMAELAASFTPALDISYLSKIFAGDRMPTIPYARGLATGLGMQFQAFVETLEQERR